MLVHDFADGLNVVTLAFAGGRSRRAALVLLGLDAAAPILGIALSQVVAVAPQTLGLLLGAFAGAFIAIGASHLLPEAEHQAARKRFAIGCTDHRRRRPGGGRSHDCRLNPSTSPT